VNGFVGSHWTDYQTATSPARPERLASRAESVESVDQMRQQPLTDAAEESGGNEQRGGEEEIANFNQ